MTMLHHYRLHTVAFQW